MMYAVAMKKQFIACHYQIGGDWGNENEEHSHHYGVEVRLEGTRLNEHGYLIDIKEVDSWLDEILPRIEDRTLNDLPEFAGLNPSIERLAEWICRSILKKTLTGISAVTVRVFEDDSAWTCCRQELS
jgi:6-pyruvoyltetrahydropterin/6-carboxytetrahydropterin synthase